MDLDLDLDQDQIKMIISDARRFSANLESSVGKLLFSLDQFAMESFFHLNDESFFIRFFESFFS